jgi:hypothetical protein
MYGLKTVLWRVIFLKFATCVADSRGMKPGPIDAAANLLIWSDPVNRCASVGLLLSLLLLFPAQGQQQSEQI